jgi:hypothetical protein
MTRLALLACPLLLCLACSREAPPAPSTPDATPDAAPAAEPAPAPVAPAPTAAAPAAEDPHANFDKGAFAGTFSGAGLTLELRADGSYGLEAPDGISQGSWTHEAGSRTVRLDPGSKTAQDRVFRLVDRDTLAVADASGAPLRRQATR